MVFKFGESLGILKYTICINTGFVAVVCFDSQLKMGVTTGWGGATRLFKLIGRSKTLHLLGSSKLLTADDAMALGLAEHIVPDQPPPLEAAETLLREHYCRGEVKLVRAVKEMVVGVENSQSVAEALEWERRIFASVWGGETQKAALGKNIKHS